MESLKIEDILSNLYVLSMLGSEENIELLKKQIKFNDSNVFYGLNFKKMFHNINPYDSKMIPHETKYYITFKTGAVACMLNHYYAISDAYKKGLKYAFFIEDDVELTDSIETLNKYISELPDNFDVLNFGWIPSIVLKERRVIPVEYSKNLYRGENMDRSGAFGYMLSREGMKKVLNILKDDFIISDLMFRYLNSFYTKEPLLTHQPAFVESRIR